MPKKDPYHYYHQPDHNNVFKSEHNLKFVSAHEIEREEFVERYLDYHDGVKGEELMMRYQEGMAEHIFNVPKCALFAQMGLGKTVSTWTGIKQLFDQFEVGKVLVVAPLRVARKVWTDELEEWSHLTGRFVISKIIGTAEQRTAAMNRTDADIYLINRENFPWLVDHFKQEKDQHFRREWPWEMMVLDESTSFKSQKSVRYQAWMRIRYAIDRLVLLTGTPAPHSLMDLYSQVYMLDHGERLGRDITAYRNRWFNYVLPHPRARNGRWEAKPNAKKEIFARIADICVTLKSKDYLDMPETFFNPVRIDLSEKEQALYRKMQRDYVMEIADQTITAVNAGVLAGKLLQLCNGAIYTEDHPNWEAFHNHKLEALFEIIENTDDNIMIAYSFKSDLARIIEWMKKKKLNYRKLESEKDEDDWNAGKINYLLLHPASAGHGCNLQHGGETIVWFGLPWSLEHWLQLNARISGGHRASGKQPVVNYISYDQGYDWRIKDTLITREADQDELMDSLKLFIEEVLEDEI